jgi:uncharacterized membrane protein YgcG
MMTISTVSVNADTHSSTRITPHFNVFHTAAVSAIRAIGRRVLGANQPPQPTKQTAATPTSAATTTDIVGATIVTIAATIVNIRIVVVVITIIAMPRTERCQRRIADRGIVVRLGRLIIDNVHFANAAESIVMVVMIATTIHARSGQTEGRRSQ